MAKSSTYELCFSGFTRVEESMPDKDRFVIAQVNFDKINVSMCIFKVGENGSFLFGKKLKPFTEGHITAWKYI